MPKTFILQFDITDEPNTTGLTAIELGAAGGMKFKSINCFDAMDILELISVNSKGETHEQGDN